MGWFSDDSGDEDPAVPSSSSSNPQNEDDDEDPLDAYMNSLDSAAAANHRQSRPSGQRLDHDAEDEATSHWENKRPSSDANHVSSSRLLPTGAHIELQEDDDGDATAQSREARLAMSTTFVKAGDKRKHTHKDDQQPHSQENDEDEDSPSLQQLSEQHQEMHHQEIIPLEKVNHTTIQYHPFRKLFLPPKNSPASSQWRTEHSITCTPPIDPILYFDPEIFPEEIIKRIAKSGYESPTLVQAQTLGVALAGRDGLITASTGSGKTLAYIWPLIIHILDQPHITPNIDGPISLILCPTRELSKQVAKTAKLYIEPVNGSVVEVSGGNMGTWELCKLLKKGCEIIVGTPGRVIDVVRKKGTNLHRVTFIVLDEADRMLSMGFEKQVESILGNVRGDRQTLLLSATFGKRVERVARGWLNDPVRIAIGRTGTSSEHVDQHIMVLPSIEAKRQWLVEMLPILAPLGRAIVFVATRDGCDELSTALQRTSMFSENAESIIVSIHGDKDQSDRNAAISRFKKNSRAVMIATDVASRGLDIPDVMTVINYDAAKNLDSHVHRVGRAGRMNKAGKDDGSGEQYQQGTAYTLLTDKNADFAQTLAEAFEREGREVSQELLALCQKSKRYGGGGRKKHDKVGLGFGGTDPSTSGVGNTSNQMQPGAKRSRWGL